MNNTPSKNAANVDIKPFSEADLAEVAEAEKQCFSTPWLEADFSYALSGNCYIGLVARSEGRLVGYAFGIVLADEATLANIAVPAEFRRCGIARQLANELLAHCREKGAGECFLEVREGNEAARRLYRSLGFAEITIRKGYYDNPREDAVIMKKEWNAQ